ncbi:acyltransferase family protein [Membranihabitans marinus]|uniref:acyltransferase family protein n=1 Tax=Membranihabitans marinus TaxID=1227546 RepID=UPI001F28DBE5|nr:DUF5009 domain-containing protein [Membranihabitans marinus]
MEKAKRYLALDVFRGLTIALMILVNTPGTWSHVYSPLRHAEWHGCTPTDLVFPFFIFIVGASIYFSLRKYGDHFNSGVRQRIFKRFFLIFLIGLALNYFPFYNKSIENLRIYGVLQRIAFAYLLASLLAMFIKNKIHLAWTAIAVLIGYYFILIIAGPDQAFTLENNLVRAFDLATIGESHMYKGFGIPFDPEGLLGAIPASITAILGYLFAYYLSTTKNLKLSYLFIVGTTAIIISLLFNGIMPINKPLWTSTYVLFAGGIAILILSVLIYLIDIKKWTNWTFPFRVFGTNALFAYIISVLWVKILIIIKIGDLSGYGWLYHQVFKPIAGPLHGSFLFAITHVFFFWLITLVLYRRNIIIKV